MGESDVTMSQPVADEMVMKEIKELLAFVAALIEGIADSMDDGKIGFTDLFKFFSAFRKSSAAFKGLDKVRGKLKSLTEADKSDLNDFFAKELDIKNDFMEAYIEQAVAVAISLIDLLPLAKKAKK